MTKVNKGGGQENRYTEKQADGGMDKDVDEYIHGVNKIFIITL